jgi:hypothetical protein
LKTGFAICLYFSSKLLKYNQISKKKTKKKRLPLLLRQPRQKSGVFSIKTS